MQIMADKWSKTPTDSQVREKKRRRRDILIVLAAVGMIGMLTWVELSYFGVDSYLFLAFFNLNFILLILVLFLVVRNIFKLIIERRRKVLGSRLRTRLVLAFIAMSIVPVLLMFFISVRFLQTSVDYWFKEQVASSMNQALEVGQLFYNSQKKGLQSRVSSTLEHIRQNEYLWGGRAMEAFLEEKKQTENDLSLVGVVSPSLREQNWFSGEELDLEWPEIKEGVPWSELGERPEYWSGLWSGQNNDLLVGVLPVDEARAGFLVMVQKLEPGLMDKLQGVARGIEEYRKLEVIKYPLKVALYTILGVITLVIIFGSTWFGFKLSREISKPVMALAEGTQKIARGELDVRLEDHSDDELGLLVRSFNAMAMDLEKARENLTEANIRQRIQNEELEAGGRYMRAVLDNITAGVISVDQEGRITTVNRAAEYILGLDSSKVIGRYPLDLVGGEYGALIKDVLKQLSHLPESQWQRQLDIDVQGKMVKILVNAVILKGEKGDDYGIVAVFEDITELEKMQRIAAWREVAKRIAHEIKNPLTPIKLSAQRLEKKFSASMDDPSFFQSTELIIRQVETLQEMVKEFSAFAKLPEVRLKPDDLKTLLQETISEFRQSHRDIEWTLEVDSSLPEFNFDRDALKRVFMNLFLNACEALSSLKDKDKKVMVSADFDPQLKRVFVLVTDNGPGLSSEERARMFEPYYSSKRDGTGLGLAIVKSIVSDHGGYVRVKSNKPRGTIFVVELPVLKNRYVHQG